jgi:hypothetical protein
MKCKHCKTVFNQKLFNQKYCMTSDECVGAFLSDLTKKNEAKSKKERKERSERLKNWKDVLQTDVQKIARIIDKGLPCLARGNFGQIHGGHIYAKGHYSEMRFNLHNIHRQSAHSNKWNADDGLMREKLAIEYGQEYAEFVANLRNQPIPKLSNEEYREKHLIALKLIKELEQENGYITPKGRIELRNYANETLSIYGASQNIFTFF